MGNGRTIIIVTTTREAQLVGDFVEVDFRQRETFKKKEPYHELVGQPPLHNCVPRALKSGVAMARVEEIGKMEDGNEEERGENCLRKKDLTSVLLLWIFPSRSTQDPCPPSFFLSSSLGTRKD